MSRGDAEFVADIQAAADKLAEIVQRGRQASDDDWMPRAAAARLLEIVGVAAGSLSTELRSRRPDLRLRDAKDMRNLVAHEYHRVHPQLLWEVISRDVPSLAASLSAEINAPTISPARRGDETPAQPRPGSSPD